MKLLKTLQTLVDKTKELEETVATQTSTIERLTSQLYLANKDTGKTDIKHEYKEQRDKFVNDLFTRIIVQKALINKEIDLTVSDIWEGNRISVILADCYTPKQYGYVINLNNSTEIQETLDTIVKKVTSIANLATGNDNDTTTDTAKHLFDTTLQPIIDKGELLQFAERYDYLSTPKEEHQYLPLHLIRHIIYAYYIDNQRQFFINVANWLTNNSIADIKQKSDTIKLANNITTKLSTINPDLRPATNLLEFLLHYGYIHGYTRSIYYNDNTYEFYYKGKRYTVRPYDTLPQLKRIITDIVNKDLEHLLDNYTKWAIANNNNKQ